MELSKAFDIIIHNPLFTKLHAYDFSVSALNPVCSYLKNRKQINTLDVRIQSLKIW